jgi:hypothetical protein
MELSGLLNIEPTHLLNIGPPCPVTGVFTSWKNVQVRKDSPFLVPCSDLWNPSEVAGTALDILTKVLYWWRLITVNLSTRHKKFSILIFLLKGTVQRYLFG